MGLDILNAKDAHVKSEENLKYSAFAILVSEKVRDAVAIGEESCHVNFSSIKTPKTIIDRVCDELVELGYHYNIEDRIVASMKTLHIYWDSPDADPEEMEK